MTHDSAHPLQLQLLQRRHLLMTTALAGSLAALGCASSSAPAASDRTQPLPTGARACRFLLLGEVHDNALHHATRAAWLRELLADGRPTAVVFEQFERDQQALLDLAQADTTADATADADRLARAGGLDAEGWGWPLHRPLIEAARAGGARLWGAGLASAALRDTVRRREVPAALQPWFEGVQWTPALQQRVEREIDQGHCGVLPASQWGPMALAQRVRDAAMAQALTTALLPGGRAVLIAGNGHVRRDLGVPFYLRQAGASAADLLSVGLLEPDDPERVEPAGEPLYDRVVRTIGARREDPCVAFKAARG